MQICLGVDGDFEKGYSFRHMRLGVLRECKSLQGNVKDEELAGDAASKGVRLALEVLNRFETDFLNTVEQGNRLLDDIGCDNVGFLLDTFHMNIEEKDLGQASRMAGDRLFDFHACANDRGTPGEDHLDWGEIGRAVSLWRPLAASQDALALEGLRFLKENL